MADSACWSKGIYRPVENEDPNAFHVLVHSSFSKKDVAETISTFEAMVLHVNYPLDLLRVTSKVRVSRLFIGQIKIFRHLSIAFC